MIGVTIGAGFGVVKLSEEKEACRFGVLAASCETTYTL